MYLKCINRSSLTNHNEKRLFVHIFSNTNPNRSAPTTPGVSAWHKSTPHRSRSVPGIHPIQPHSHLLWSSPELSHRSHYGPLRGVTELSLIHPQPPPHVPHLHCSDPAPLQLLVNSTKCHSLEGDDTSSAFDIISRMPHPHFDKFTLAADLAVIHVDDTMEFQDVLPIALLDRSLRVGESVQVYGWNYDFLVTRNMQQLFLAQTTVIAAQSCVHYYGTRFVVGQMLCMDMWTFKEPSGDPRGCEMDPSAVAIVEVAGVKYVGALALFAGGCMYEGWPGVYLNTFPYNSWIKERFLDDK